jgi:hypothetical protein
MTERQMRNLAGRRIAFHWIKLYRPERLNEWKLPEKTKELPHEFEAFLTIMQFMDRNTKHSTGYKLRLLTDAIDIRETRQLCLGGAIPSSILDEAELVRKEAEDLLAGNEEIFRKRSDGQVEFEHL